MSFEHARNIQDAALNPAAFALPASAGSTNSTAVDLGAATLQPENLELELNVPALNATQVPDTRTVDYLIESAGAADFATVTQTLLNERQTGAGGAGVAAFLKRVRLPANCARYVRAKITTGASTGNCSAVSATFTLRF